MVTVVLTGRRLYIGTLVQNYPGDVKALVRKMAKFSLSCTVFHSPDFMSSFLTVWRMTVCSELKFAG